MSNTTFSAQELANFEGENYIRNSVKAVVDAFDGSVDFDVFDPSDLADPGADGCEV